jgi:hypothetical protein
MANEDFRRPWVYAAWILLLAAAVEVAIGAWTLSGLPGGPESQFGQAIGSPLWLRGEVAMPNLLQLTITALPVSAVLLVVFAGRLAGTVRPVTLVAVTIQTAALALGLLAWVAALGKASRWEDVSWAIDIAVAVAGLILTSAVLRSRGADALTHPRAGAGQG